MSYYYFFKSSGIFLAAQWYNLQTNENSCQEALPNFWFAPIILRDVPLTVATIIRSSWKVKFIKTKTYLRSTIIGSVCLTLALISIENGDLISIENRLSSWLGFPEITEVFATQKPSQEYFVMNKFTDKLVFIFPVFHFWWVSCWYVKNQNEIVRPKKAIRWYQSLLSERF